MAEQIPFQKIVVPLDGSKWAERAIPHAEQIARGGGELMLVHVFKPAGSEFIGDSAIAKQTAHIDEARNRAEQYVKGLRGQIMSQQVKVSAHVVEGNDVAQLICNFVTAEEADVVVMPSASHNRLARILMGDLTSSVTGCVKACMLLVRGNLEAEWHEESAKALGIGRTDPAPTSVPESSAPDSTALLHHLTTLRDAGILSAEEFATKEQEIQKLQSN